MRFHPLTGFLIVDSLHVIEQNIESLEIGNIYVQFRLLSLESLCIVDSRIRLIHGDEAINLAIEKIEAN